MSKELTYLTMLFPVAQIETLGAEDGYNAGSFMSHIKERVNKV